MKRLSITYPISREIVFIKARDSKEKRMSLRLFAIAQVMKSVPVQDICDWYDLTRETLGKWIKKFNKHGIDGLLEQAGRGRKSKLSNNEKESLKKIILKSPRSFGYPSNNWTGKLLVKQIKKAFGVEYKLSSIFVLLKQLGFTLQRPGRKYGEAKMEDQKIFREQLKKKSSLSPRQYSLHRMNVLSSPSQR